MQMGQIIRTGVVQIMLLPNLIAGNVYAQTASDSESGPKRVYTLVETLRGDIEGSMAALQQRQLELEMRLLELQAQLEIMSLLSLPEEVKAIQTESAKQELLQAKTLLGDETRSTTVLGKQAQDEFSKAIKELPTIDKNSSLEEVKKFKNQVKDIAALKDRYLDQAIGELNEAMAKGKVTARELIPEAAALEHLGKEKLRSILSQIKPDIGNLEGLTQSDLAKRIGEFATGDYFAESINALAPHFKDKIAPSIAKAAQAVTEVHRAGTEMATAAMAAMQMALMTGNPYIILFVGILMALMALFKFGGGGSGSGKGKGKGQHKGPEGPKSEVSEAEPGPGTGGGKAPGNPPNQDSEPDSKNGKPGSVPGPGGSGQLRLRSAGEHALCEGGPSVLSVRKGKDCQSPEAFAIDLAAIKSYNGDPHSMTFNDLNDTSAHIRSFDPPAIVFDRGQSIDYLYQKNGAWEIVRGKPLESGNMDSRVLDSNGFIVVRNNRGIGFEVDPLKVYRSDDINMPFPIDVSQIKSVSSVANTPESQRLVVQYQHQNTTFEARLAYSKEVSKWLLSSPQLPD